MSIRIIADFSSETLRVIRAWQNILSHERGKPTTKIALFSKDFTQIQERNQNLYKQVKAKRTQQHQTNSSTNAKGSSLDRNTENS